MRQLAATVLVAALLAVGTPSVAHGDTPRCVSQREFTRVSTGMTMRKVHRIFDTRGSMTGLGAPNAIRHYRPCGRRGGLVQVTYDSRDRVVAKSAQFY